MNKLIIHGRIDSTTATTDFAGSFRGMIQPKVSARIHMARAGDTTHEIDVNDDDIVELELEEGVKLWVRAEFLEHDFPQRSNRDVSQDGFELPHRLPIGTASRGIGEWVIKGLKIFGIDVAGKVTDIVSDKVEGILKPGPGLYRWGAGGPEDLKRTGSLRAHKPIALFIHGTASSTDGSFGGLWEGNSSSRMGELLHHFDNQVLAFQHRTLTESPITNALELAEKLPASAHLYLVSHSRGGLVGELLCRGMIEGQTPFDREDLALFEGQEYKIDRDNLKELGTLLKKKQFVIERFIRVGCPARGTTLASGRLDRYLSVILNVLEKIPVLKTSSIYDGFSALLLAVVKKRTDPRELPGLAAQMPDSPLIALLNRPDIRSQADLHVLGGDVAGEGVWGKLKTFVTDLFYREDHDLVVNTKAMLGGADRSAGVNYWIDTGRNVNHFNYFRNTDTVTRLMSALTGSDATLYHRLEAKPSQVTVEDYRKRTLEPQPVVFVLPGIMGSHLKVKKDRVWFDLWDLAKGDLKDLEIESKDVSPDGLIGQGYKDLIRFLSESHEVIPFDYDWRRSIRETADRLRKDLEKKLEDTEPTGQPIRIIAHSMGGLVVRAMLATPEGEKVWNRMGKQPGSRFIMLGTPNGGSHAFSALLMGRDAFIKKLALLDLRHSHQAILKIISRFDGALQLLPHTGSLDAYDFATWEKLHKHDTAAQRGLFSSPIDTDESAELLWPLPEKKRLVDARNVRDLLTHSPLDSDRMLYVAGVAPATACDVTIDEQAPKGHRVHVHATPNGDGRVPWATGIPDGLKERAYYMNAEHGDLANHSEVFPGFFDLLNRGSTTKLSRTPPSRRGFVDAPSILEEATPFMYPDEADLIASALGSTTKQKTAEVQPKVNVRVLHGSLAWATSPVVVGHYIGDTIVSAEAYLDKQLNGRLRDAHQLNLYPGKLNTNEIFLNDMDNGQLGTHPGAIVVGLGAIGELTPGRLTHSYSQAVTTYALRLIERERRKRAQNGEELVLSNMIDASLTSLLVGTGGAGLHLKDSLQSILRGVHQVNQRLASLKRDEYTSRSSEDKKKIITAFINEIVIVELYEDLAIRATKALLELGESAEFQDHFLIEELLEQGRGARSRAYYDEDPAWWQRLQISTQENGALKFHPLTERARAETSLQLTQKKLVERFLTQAESSSASHPELCSTLFELLIPNRLKEYAPDRRNLQLVLDEQSAAYPWELMQDGSEQGREPLSVEAGMIRQLSLSSVKVRENVVETNDLRALIIGDPTSHDQGGEFAPLPGAAREARAVAKQLRHSGYYKEVWELVEENATPYSILNALYTGSYQVIHIAAHGVFEYPIGDKQNSLKKNTLFDPWAKPDTVTGVVLGDEVFLTPAEFEQMRYVPKLVFINCCHLGETQGDAETQCVQYHQLASNVSTQFIRMGVRAVIAAGWAVDDRAASTFAQTFYQQLLDGTPFGESVREARQKIYRDHGHTNTWGAYQCYGDPDFSLTLKARRSQQRTRIVAAAELRVEIDNLTQRAKGESNEEKKKQLLSQLENYIQSMGPTWTQSAATSASIARAYGELGQFEKAVEHYEIVTKAEPADAHIQSLEQLVNLKVRWATQLDREQNGKKVNRQKSTEHRKPEDLLTEAEKLLQSLCDIGKTPERLSLKGSLYKRRAIVEKRSSKRSTLLHTMAESYREAYELAKKAKTSNLYYPLENALAAEIVCDLGSPKSKTSSKTKKEIEKGLGDLKHLGEESARQAKDFWSLCIRPSWNLLDCLYRDALSEKNRLAIAHGYLHAKKRGGSDREMGSVRENLKFLAEMISTQALANRRKVLSDFIQKLEKDLTSDTK